MYLLMSSIIFEISNTKYCIRLHVIITNKNEDLIPSNIRLIIICIYEGAEPSPAYFNIMMYNNREAILDGTQLAADWTFSGLQKFGQGLLDKLRGLKLPHPLLEKVIPYANGPR